MLFRQSAADGAVSSKGLPAGPGMSYFPATPEHVFMNAKGFWQNAAIAMHSPVCYLQT